MSPTSEKKKWTNGKEMTSYHLNIISNKIEGILKQGNNISVITITNVLSSTFKKAATSHS